MDAKKLKLKIVEKGLNVTTTAQKVGINRALLYSKLRGDDKITICEANKLKEILDLTNSEAIEIFFS